MITADEDFVKKLKNFQMWWAYRVPQKKGPMNIFLDTLYIKPCLLYQIRYSANLSNISNLYNTNQMYIRKIIVKQKPCKIWL